MILEAFRKLWLKLRGRQPILRGECIRCGQCCRGIHLKLGGNWLKSEKAFRRAIERNPHYAIFQATEKDPQGLLRFSCTKVGENNFCTDYENRPSVCRKYPSSARRELGEGPVVDENA